MFAMVIFWGAIIALVAWLLRGGTGSRPEPPQEILRRRLADGSISVEEYEQRTAALDPSTPRPGSDAAPGTTGGPTAPSPSP
jgi:hypothetical protein